MLGFPPIKEMNIHRTTHCTLSSPCNFSKRHGFGSRAEKTTLSPPATLRVEAEECCPATFSVVEAPYSTVQAPTSGLPTTSSL